MNGDSILLEDLALVSARHRAAGAAVTMVTVRVRDTELFGALQVAPDGRITGFGEKIAKGEGIINAGVYVMARSILTAIDVPSSLERDVFPRLIGLGMMSYPSQAPFIDIGNPDSYARIEVAAAKYLRMVGE